MRQMIARRAHRFDGRELQEGEKFDCEERFVKILMGMGVADVDKSETQTREMTASPAAGYDTRHLAAKQGRGRRRKSG